MVVRMPIDQARNSCNLDLARISAKEKSPPGWSCDKIQHYLTLPDQRPLTYSRFGHFRSAFFGIRLFQREAARSVSVALEASTSKHKQAQQGVTAAAAEALRRALEVAGEEEVACTKAVLRR